MKRRGARGRTRMEGDSLGRKAVPAGALYGIFTERARQTFSLSGLRAHPAFIRSLGMIKQAAAEANGRLGLLPPRLARAIEWAADQVRANRVDSAFVLDVFQAGAGTPHHMNANEVIANLANERLGGRRGAYDRVHPNNHVNLGQSSNDVTPTAARLTALQLLTPLAEEIRRLEVAFRAHGRAAARVVKPGRTHLQDAVPITFGQVFTGYAEALARCRRGLTLCRGDLLEVGLGGTAVGTGITAHPRFGRLVARALARIARLPLRPARSPVETTWNMVPLVRCSAALRDLALTVSKICMDLRLLASGPHTGLGELILPAVEPGSSIMPGKINPSVPEAVQMVCFQVMGNDATVARAAEAGELELNVMTPLIAFDLWRSLELLTHALRLLRSRCVEGLRVDRRRARALVEGSLIEATALSPYLGYDVAAALVKEALARGRPLREVVLGRRLVDPAALDRLLAPAALTRPQRLDARLRRRIQRTPAFRAFRQHI
ncbi:MAG: aspartate ammonia-lyase [Candidatus Rokubacteria bacterium]|nr:aspartate ammonia-lyase [Candidatus Rokubacteria bacterium]